MISQLAQRLGQELLDALPLIRNFIPERELKTSLQSILAKLNLVTREEFDAQTTVLQRTRLKLEALELRCAEIEQALYKK
jgi:BMFP domain-containing protein YqiC